MTDAPAEAAPTSAASAPTDAPAADASGEVDQLVAIAAKAIGTLQSKIDDLHVQRKRLTDHKAAIVATKENATQESKEIVVEFEAKVAELRNIMDKYEGDMKELTKRDEEWMLKTLDEQQVRAGRRRRRWRCWCWCSWCWRWRWPC